MANKPLPEIDIDDIQEYLGSLPGRPSQEIALAAFRSLWKMMGKAIDRQQLALIGRSEKRLIDPITWPDMERMLKCATLKQRAMLLVLWDTGMRIGTLVNLRIEHWRGNYIECPPEITKTRAYAVPALTKKTVAVLTEYIEQEHPTDKIFGGAKGNVNKWLERIARESGIEKHVYPHLFRHSRALRFREDNTPLDVVLNHLGWLTADVYNNLYGRRPARVTVNVARSYVERLGAHDIDPSYQ